MSNDHFIEVTHEGWFSRIGKSLVGMVFGFVLAVVAVPLLWWNEGRTVKTYQGLMEGQKATVEVKSDAVDPANEGKLVYTTGRTQVVKPARDAVFGAWGDTAVKLARDVELYQWVEQEKTTTKTKMGGGEETVVEYTYTQKWDHQVHDSGKFKSSLMHQNPPPAYREAQWQAEDVRLSAFRLPESLISVWSDYQPHPLPPVESLPEALRAKASLRDGWLYISRNPDRPEVGDARVKFKSILVGDASVLACQNGDTFTSYLTKSGTTISRIASGIRTKEAMFKEAHDENNLWKWVLRGVGFVMMLFGLAFVLNPLAVLADVVPFIGRLVGGGMMLIAFLLTVAGSCLTIALAWIWYRPLIGAALLAVGLGGLFLLFNALRKKTA